MGRRNTPSRQLEPPDDSEPEEPDDRPAQLRAAYIQAVRRHRLNRTGVAVHYNSKPCWDGGYDQNSGKYYKIPVWPKLVAKADEAGVDPFELVAALFASTAGERAPTPHEITSEENIARLRSSSRTSADGISESARTEVAVFRAAVRSAERRVTDPDPRAPIRTVINDLSCQISPLFRYCMAVAAGHTDLADSWRGRAASQFNRNPTAYKQSWGHLLPTDMNSGDTRGH